MKNSFKLFDLASYDVRNTIDLVTSIAKTNSTAFNAYIASSTSSVSITNIVEISSYLIV